MDQAELRTQNKRSYLLEIIAFVSGAVIMILELAGSRILAPYLGTSLFVWTSLIGVILASLSAGYYWGGRIADRKPTFKNLSLILFFSGLSLICTALVNHMILSAIQNTIPNIPVGAVIATLTLFSPPSILLAMTVPYVVKLKMKTLDTSGRTVGRLYSISTIGSIFGTFLAGFFLISYFGSTKILYVLSGVMLFSALISSPADIRRLASFIVFSVPFLWGAKNLTSPFQSTKRLDVDTKYNRVNILDTEDESTGEKIRVMQINEGSGSAAYREREDLYFEYTKYYLLAGHFKKDMKRSLMLGGAAYSFPKYYVKRFPKAEIDVVEIDPGLTVLARQYFGLSDHPRLRIFHEDARTYLNRSRHKYKYDAILVDVFWSMFSQPVHVTTVEAVRRMYDLLESDGIVIANLVSTIEGNSGKFLRAEYHTYRTVFPDIWLFPVQNPENGKQIQNLMLVAFKKKPGNDFLMSDDPQLAEFLNHRWWNEIPADVPILTDEYAPVELYTFLAFSEWKSTH